MTAMYTEDEKRIFSYRKGKQVVHVDPLALRRKLAQASGGRFHQLVRTARQPFGDPQEPTQTEVLARCAAEEQLLAVVREAFGLPAWDETSPGKGCLDADCFEALRLWFGWLEKNARPAGS